MAGGAEVPGRITDDALRVQPADRACVRLKAVAASSTLLTVLELARHIAMSHRD